MAQVDVFPDDKTLSVLIRQDRPASGTRLSDNVGGPGIVEEAVVDAARVPRVDALRAAERGIAHEGVAASIVVAGVVMGTVVVFLSQT